MTTKLFKKFTSPLLWLMMTLSPPCGWSKPRTESASSGDAPSCQKLWDTRKDALKKTVFTLPSAKTCPATRTLMLSYGITNGHAQNFSLKEMMDFAERFPLWPKRSHLLPIIETQVLARATSPSVLIHWFSQHGPQTVNGMIWYTNYLRKEKKNHARQALIKQFWIHRSFSPVYQQKFLQTFSKDLTPQDHRQQVIISSLQGHLDQASWTLRKVGQSLPKATHEYFKRLKKPPSSPEACLKNIPAGTMEHAILLELAQKQNIKVRKKADSQVYGQLALKGYRMIRAYDRSPAKNLPLDIQERLWKTRHDVIRALILKQRYQQALEVAQAHNLPPCKAYVTAEKQAGWLSLRLKRPQDALKHFQKALQHVTQTHDWIEIQFWLGHSYGLLKKPKEAQQAYRKAAWYFNNFFGQQAFFRLSPSVDDPQKLPRPSVKLNQHRVLSPGAEKECVKVLKQVVVLDRHALFEDFLNATRGVQFEEATTQSLIKHVVQHGNPAQRVHTYKYLLMSNPHIRASSDFYPHLKEHHKPFENIHPDFWLGVAHYESSLNPTVRGAAGEYGLMQIMPQTARLTSEKHAIPFKNYETLLSEPDLNIRLGCAYLKEVHQEVPGSTIFMVAGYNAGPHRVKFWIEELGMPGENMSEIDWIESIPIIITSNYVRKTLANAQTYHYWRTGHLLKDPFKPHSFLIPSHASTSPAHGL